MNETEFLELETLKVKQRKEEDELNKKGDRLFMVKHLIPKPKLGMKCPRCGSKLVKSGYVDWGEIWHCPNDTYEWLNYY